jgi:DegV family protein with EDD domain
MKIKISADSTCDLSPELAEQKGIFLAPLCFIIDNKTYYEHVDLTPDDVFDAIENKNLEVKTAALNIVEYGEIFKKLLEENDVVIHIDISSKASSCYQNASMAASELKNVYTVDSKNISTGFGSVVLEAAEMANSGKYTPEQICERLNNFVTSHTETSFVLDTLKYMHKGGRCTGVAALGANILQLKPCIQVVDGVMGVGKKYRGALSKVLMEYVKDRLEGRTDIDTSRLIITHTCRSPELVDAVREKVAEYVKFDEVMVTHAGCSVSIHCGPGTLGMIYKTK